MSLNLGPIAAAANATRSVSSLTGDVVGSKAVRAIAFGMNYAGSDCELHGCHNDAEAMAKYLKEVRGYPADRVRVLNDAGATQPHTTRDGMLAALRELAQQTRADELDEVFITYSGHGAQVRDLSGREEDGMNEVILPTDFRQAGYISDDLINAILRDFNPRTKVVCSFDCCHSGSVADLRYKFTYDRDSHSVARSEQPSAPHMPPLVYTLSGCRDDQVSMDAFNVRGAGRYTGAMTSCLTRALEAHANEPTLLQLFASLHDLLKDANFVQKPVLFASRPVDADDKF